MFFSTFFKVLLIPFFCLDLLYYQLPLHIGILLSAVTQINEPDSLYGIIQSHKVVQFISYLSERLSLPLSVSFWALVLTICIVLLVVLCFWKLSHLRGFLAMGLACVLILVALFQVIRTLTSFSFFCLVFLMYALCTRLTVLIINKVELMKKTHYVPLWDETFAFHCFLAFPTTWHLVPTRKEMTFRTKAQRE